MGRVAKADRKQRTQERAKLFKELKGIEPDADRSKKAQLRDLAKRLEMKLYNSAGTSEEYFELVAEKEESIAARIKKKAKRKRNKQKKKRDVNPAK